MDCQTESHVDAETVKAKKRIECHRCAQDFRMNSASKTAETLALPADVDAAIDSNFMYEPSFDMESFEHEDVLDISVIPFAHAYPEQAKVNDAIFLAPDELKVAPLVEETSAFTSQQIFANHSPESIAQSVPESDSEDESAALEALAETHLSEGETAYIPRESKNVGLAAFSTPKLVTIAATFILLISVAGMINSSVGKVNLNAKSSMQVAANPAEQEVEQNSSTATPVSAAETNKPTPSPSPSAPQENSSTTTTPTVNQSAVNEATVNQAAMNEPAATDAAPFTVQVGSHNQMDLANSQMEQLRGAGYAPRVVGVEIPKRGRWYRVQVGNFADRKEAQQFGSQLVSKGVVETFVIADQ